MHPFHYLYAGVDGKAKLVPLMWVSSIFAISSLVLLVFPSLRKNEKILAAACSMLFISLWIDKGFGLVIGGFVPNMFEGITEYWPTLPEAMITLGVWAIGSLVLTVLYKVAVSVREEAA
jgi:molybdopterin-containing oxidoreductase family membrane subunit